MAGAVQNGPVDLGKDRRRQHDVGALTCGSRVTVLDDQQLKSFQTCLVDKITREQQRFGPLRQGCARNAPSIGLNFDVVCRFHHLAGELPEDVTVFKGARGIADKGEIAAGKFLEF